MVDDDLEDIMSKPGDSELDLLFSKTGAGEDTAKVAGLWDNDGSVESVSNTDTRDRDDEVWTLNDCTETSARTVIIRLTENHKSWKSGSLKTLRIVDRLLRLAEHVCNSKGRVCLKSRDVCPT